MLQSSRTPILFDVSLRDGIQCANKNDYHLIRKIEVFENILRIYNPDKFEIGSLANPKILPIMSDTLDLFNYICREHPELKERIYVLIPSINKLTQAIENNIQNFSFITSVSESFQKKNTNKTIQEVKEDFKNVFQILCREPLQNSNTKLYISCINICPIQGKIDNDFIINELFEYYTDFSFDELCISDTCGELLFNDFQYIITESIKKGIPPSKFSIHLHNSFTPSHSLRESAWQLLPLSLINVECLKNMENIKQIIDFSFLIGINKFDVSYLETGGCSVTMDSKKIKSNLNYDFFVKPLSI